MTTHLPPKVIQLFFRQSLFQIRARIHAWRTVSLVKHQVSRVTALSTAEEMIKAHVI